jgi:hypothetical protein
VRLKRLMRHKGAVVGVEVCALSTLCAIRVPWVGVEVCALSALCAIRVPRGRKKSVRLKERV